jgi:hypothetical protein
MDKILGDVLVHRDGSEVSVSEALKDVDYVGLYFSAHVRPRSLGRGGGNPEFGVQ